MIILVAVVVLVVVSLMVLKSESAMSDSSIYVPRFESAIILEYAIAIVAVSIH